MCSLILFLSFVYSIWFFFCCVHFARWCWWAHHLTSFFFIMFGRGILQMLEEILYEHLLFCSLSLRWLSMWTLVLLRLRVNKWLVYFFSQLSCRRHCYRVVSTCKKREESRKKKCVSKKTKSWNIKLNVRFAIATGCHLSWNGWWRFHS